MQTERSPRRIHLLAESVARQIAAGEVIDRPSSVVRELIDNSLDAGSSEISVSLTGGGIAALRVVDNGTGMTLPDLELCHLPHATSKIETAEDLAAVRSLGFRGEALSSIAACSRLTITSRSAGPAPAHRLTVEGGKLVALEEAKGNPGTVVEAADLFYAIPGRRRFLKNPSAETALCRTVLLDKALPFPGTAFRLFVDGELKIFLPAAASDRTDGSGAGAGSAPPSRGTSLLDRVAAAYPAAAPRELLHLFEGEGTGFSLTLVAGGPSLSRRDRRYIQIFVNNRRIAEFGLVQAIEYGFSELFPGGSYPVAFLFLNIDPALVDFNIHPAKREARFRTLPEIHHTLVELIKSEAGRFSLSFDRPRFGSEHALAPIRGGGPAERSSTGRRPEAGGTTSPSSFGRPAASDNLFAADSANAVSAWRGLRSIREGLGAGAPAVPEGAPALEHGAAAGGDESSPRYYGQLFGLFLIVQAGERLFLIDQHAAHERLLFDRLVAQARTVQPLLIPITFDVNPDEEALLSRNRASYAELGISIEPAGEGRFRLLALPQAAEALAREVIEFVKSARGASANLMQELYATIACRAAVKEGDTVDDMTARELVAGAFKLDNARCPHGRPIWHELSREELYRLVGRT